MGVAALTPGAPPGDAPTAGARPAVFVDRDGVLNRAYVREGVTHPPRSLDEVELLPGVAEALATLAGAGFALVGITNQPDVSRGRQTRDVVEAINARVAAPLGLLAVLTCYHDDPDACACRKPRPGLLLEAAARYGLDLASSVMVGDRWSDVVAGQAAGCRTVLVETPHSRAGRCRPDAVAADLPSAVSIILGWRGPEP